MNAHPDPDHTPGLPRALTGLVIWSVFFVAAYGGLSAGCAVGLDTGTGRVSPRDPLTQLLALLLLVHLLALVLLTRSSLRRWRTWRRRQRSDDDRSGADHGFMLRLTALIDTAALAGTAWVGFPLLLLPPCI